MTIRNRSHAVWLTPLLALTCALAAPLPDSQRLVAEVARAVAEGRPADLPPAAARDPLASALARVITDRAAGREARAERAALAALRSVEPPEADDPRADLEAELWLRLLEEPPDEPVRVELATRAGPVGDAAFALLQAREERCTRALESAGRLERSAAGPVRRLLAEVYRRCGEVPRALGLLREADPSDPRTAREIGWALLAAGDPSSASVWCHRALEDGAAIPSLRYGAARCAAVADARRGLLPEAWERYAGALVARYRDPAAPPASRRRAALAAAWVRLAPGSPEGARVALPILDELLRERGADDARVRPLRAMALALLEQPAAAQREVARAGRAGCYQEFARGFLAEQQHDAIAASAAYGRAEECARAEGDDPLAAAIALGRARLAAADRRAPLVRHHVQEALASWDPAWFDSPDAPPLADPALPRRAIELALGQLLDVGGEGAATLEAVGAAEQFRRTLAREERELPDLGRLRRHLAARNGALLYLVLGETRSFAWLVQPGAVASAELPSGSELAQRLERQEGGAPSVSLIVGGLLSGLGRGTALLVIPDGLLAGVPWHDLLIVEPRTGAREPLGEGFDLTLMPTLASAIAPAGARTQGLMEEPTFLALTAGPDPFLSRLVTLPALSRLSGLRIARLEPPADAALREQLRGGHAILHVRLPLQSGGRSVVLALPAGETVELDVAVARSPQIDLVTLDPRDGFAAAAASRVRAAERLVEAGARTALVPLEPMAPEKGPPFWESFYTELGRGRRKTEALRRALAATGRPAHFALIGHADTRVVAPVRILWPIWVALAAVLVVLSAVLLRAFRRPADPFDIEPPEEEEEEPPKEA